MNITDNVWDKTMASEGEMYDFDAMMEELYSDPEFAASMEERKIEALEHQLFNQELPF